MQTRLLGRTGIEVSKFGLGTMVLGAWGNNDLAECERIINTALDRGINLIDTADVYGGGENESLVGRALAMRRSDVVLCTKFHHPIEDDVAPNRRGNSRRWIMTAIDDSLRRLDVDHIDLYQVHRPDPTVDISETIGALTDLVRQGKIRAWGTSTFPAEDVVEAHWAAERTCQIGPHTEQAPYSILCRGVERDVFPTARRHGMGILTWSPLSGGWLTGKYQRGAAPPSGSRGQTKPEHFDVDNPAKFDATESLARVAKDVGIPLAHLALSWATTHPAVSSVLIGPRTLTQLNELTDAADVALTDDVLDAVDEIVQPGTNLNQADVGWSPPGLAASARRQRAMQ